MACKQSRPAAISETNSLFIFLVLFLFKVIDFLLLWLLRENTVVIVSHDRGFLNRTTGVTMWMFRKRLWYYGGNYDTFVKVRGEQMRHRSAIVEQQERKKAQLTQFISRCVWIDSTEQSQGVYSGSVRLLQMLLCHLHYFLTIHLAFSLNRILNF